MAAIAVCLVLCLATSAAALLPSSSSLWPFRKAISYQHITLQEALFPGHHADAATLLIVGTTRPNRRAPGQPALTFSPQAGAAVPHAVQQLLVQAMTQLQALGAGTRFELQLDVLPAGTTSQGQERSQLLAVFDASSGRLLLGPYLLGALQATPLHVVSAAGQATTAAAQHLLQLAGQALPTSCLHLLQLLPRAAAAGVAVAFAAAVPRWFCFVCPIVLGLLAPLVINAGVGEATDLACAALQLSDEECVDLWFAALGLGMILSLLSAVPIYKVCQLYECAHPGPNSTTGSSIPALAAASAAH